MGRRWPLRRHPSQQECACDDDDEADGEDKGKLLLLPLRAANSAIVISAEGG